MKLLHWQFGVLGRKGSAAGRWGVTCLACIFYPTPEKDTLLLDIMALPHLQILFMLQIIQYKNEIYRKQYRKDLCCSRNDCSTQRLFLFPTHGPGERLEIISVADLRPQTHPSSIHLHHFGLEVLSALLLSLYKPPRHQLLFFYILSVLSVEVYWFLVSLLFRVLTISGKKFSKESRINNNLLLFFFFLPISLAHPHLYS